MAALDEAAPIMEVADLYVGTTALNLVNVGAVRNVRFMGKQERVEIKSDNRGTIRNRARLRGQADAEMLEVGNVDIQEVVFKGLVTKGTVAGTPVSGATQALASPFVPNTFYEFEHQQGDGTVPTSISVSGATDGALTLNTDYHIIQNPNTGKWGIVLNTVAGGPTITTLTQVITFTYSYTPAAAKTLTGGTSQTATNLYVRLVGPSEDDSNLTRQLDLAECTNIADFLMGWNDVEEAGDVVPQPVSFLSNKNTSWTLTDKINAS